MFHHPNWVYMKLYQKVKSGVEPRRLHCRCFRDSAVTARGCAACGVVTCSVSRAECTASVARRFWTWRSAAGQWKLPPMPGYIFNFIRIFMKFYTKINSTIRWKMVSFSVKNYENQTEIYHFRELRSRWCRFEDRFNVPSGHTR